MDASLWIANYWQQSRIPSLQEWRLKTIHMFFNGKLVDITKARLGNGNVMTEYPKRWNAFFCFIAPNGD